jgi:nitrate reductase assembly molybdenum cofactor insertion protein NarJ
MSTRVQRPDATTKRLIREAAEWRLLALLFECPREGWHGQVASVAAEIRDPDLRAAARAAETAATQGLYHSIFGPGGPVSPREVSYHDSIQLGYLLSELRCCYDAFAYKPVSEEAVDHLSLEIGFIGYLRLKEAFMTAGGDPERAALAREAAQRFLAEHLAVSAEPIARALATGGPPYLVLTSRALASRVGPRSKGSQLPIMDSQILDISAENSLFSCVD